MLFPVPFLPVPIGPISSVGSAVTGAAQHVVGGVIGAGVDAVFSGAGQWVASGAVWLLGQVGHALSATTSVNLTSGWFSAHESVMVALAAAVVLPMVLCAAFQALYRQSASMLARSFLVNLPLALLFTGVAVELVQMALAITDTLSSQVLAGSGVDTTNVLAPVSDFLAGSAVISTGVPAFVVFIGGLLVAVSCLVLWLELVVRAAAVSVAVLFLPLALAALVWPAVSHWCRRLADTLAALILSKLVIAAVLSLAAGALAGGLGLGASGGNGGGFAAVITGIALLAIATFSPFTLLKLIPAIEAGATSHLESTRHRLAATAQAPSKPANWALEYARSVGAEMAGGSSGGGGSGGGGSGGGGSGGGSGAARLALQSAVGSAPPVTAMVSGEATADAGVAGAVGGGVGGAATEQDSDDHGFDATTGQDNTGGSGVRGIADFASSDLGFPDSGSGPSDSSSGSSRSGSGDPSSSGPRSPASTGGETPPPSGGWGSGG